MVLACIWQIEIEKSVILAKLKRNKMVHRLFFFSKLEKIEVKWSIKSVNLV